LALAQTVTAGAMLEAHKPWLCTNDKAKQEEAKADAKKYSGTPLSTACEGWNSDDSKSEIAKDTQSEQVCIKQFLSKACPIAQPSGSVPKLS